MSFFFRCTLLWALMINAPLCLANLGADVTLTSDYVYRGISQSDEKPALQGNIYMQSEDSGLYVSLFGTTLGRDTVNGDADFEIDLGFGAQGIFPLDIIPFFPQEWAESDWLGWDTSARYYFYPGADPAPGRDDFNFWELAAGLSFHFDLFSTWTRLAWTPDLYGNLDDGRYYAGGISIPLPWNLTYGAHVGFQDIAENDNGENDTLDWSLSLSHELRPDIILTGAYTDTDWKGSNNCFYGSGLCDARALISITRRW